MNSNPLVLKQWKLTTALVRDDFVSIQIWVKFLNLHGCLRTTKNLSRITSCIGTLYSWIPLLPMAPILHKLGREWKSTQNAPSPVN